MDIVVTVVVVLVALAILLAVLSFLGFVAGIVFQVLPIVLVIFAVWFFVKGGKVHLEWPKKADGDADEVIDLDDDERE